MTRDRSAMLLEQANREVYLLLKEGIKVSVPDRERGGQKTERLCVIDLEHPANNDFLLVSQFSVTGALSATSAFFLQPSSLPRSGSHRVEEARRALVGRGLKVEG